MKQVVDSVRNADGFKYSFIIYTVPSNPIVGNMIQHAE